MSPEFKEATGYPDILSKEGSVLGLPIARSCDGRWCFALVTEAQRKDKRARKRSEKWERENLLWIAIPTDNRELRHTVCHAHLEAGPFKATYTEAFLLPILESFETVQEATEELSHCRRLLDAAGYHQGIHNGIQAALQRADLFVEACTKALNERDAAIHRAEHSEAAHLHTIDQRDSAEDALSDAFRLVTGREPEWSNLFGYANALEEITETLDCKASALAAARKEAEGYREALEKIRASCFRHTNTLEIIGISDAALNGESHD